MDTFKVYNCTLEIQTQMPQSCIGATNIEDCFVGQIKQRGPIPNGGATLYIFDEDNHRGSLGEPVVHGPGSHIGFSCY